MLGRCQHHRSRQRLPANVHRPLRVPCRPREALHRKLRVAAIRINETLCHPKQRYLGAQLTLHNFPRPSRSTQTRGTALKRSTYRVAVPSLLEGGTFKCTELPWSSFVADVTIKWELSELGEIVTGRTNYVPMALLQMRPTPGLQLAVRRDGPASFFYFVFSNEKRAGGGCMMLINNGQLDRPHVVGRPPRTRLRVGLRAPPTGYLDLSEVLGVALLQRDYSGWRTGEAACDQ